MTVAVFSYMAGIYHAYYLVALAPALGGLVGTGAVLLWRRRDELWARAVLAAGLAGTGVWAAVLLDRVPDWHPELRSVVLVAALGGAAALLVPALLAGRWAVGVAGVGLVAVLAAPGAYALATAAEPKTGPIPSAGPAGASVGPGGRGMPGGRRERLPRWAGRRGRVPRPAPRAGWDRRPGRLPGGFPGGQDGRAGPAARAAGAARAVPAAPRSTAS